MWYLCLLSIVVLVVSVVLLKDDLRNVCLSGLVCFVFVVRVCMVLLVDGSMDVVLFWIEYIDKGTTLCGYCESEVELAHYCTQCGEEMDYILVGNGVFEKYCSECGGLFSLNAEIYCPNDGTKLGYKSYERIKVPELYASGTTTGDVRGWLACFLGTVVSFAVFFKLLVCLSIKTRRKRKED